jgi:hypothetical protein
MRATYDSASFAAGRHCGTRVAACIARAAAVELLQEARWWNRWKRRLMASALVACAEDLESEAASNATDEGGAPPRAGRRRRAPGPALSALQ